MSNPEALVIQNLSSADAEDTALMVQLTDLINEVYRVAEDGLWVRSIDRTSRTEITGLVRAREIAVARLNGSVVGCLRVQRLDAETGEFGMLAADLEYRGVGIGRELIRYAEEFARDNGHTRMQLELLVPLEWTHPSKKFLADWYARIGYVVTDKRSIEEIHPAVAPYLATPCEFLIWHKNL